MKVLMKPIEMIASFNIEGKLRPARYRLVEENVVIKIDRIDYIEEEKLAGNKMYIYRCTSIVGGAEKVYELKYEIGTCKWFLYKM